MSLILNYDTSRQWRIPEDATAADEREAALLDRYLAIMETNRQSSRFVPNDALLALDMAGFVRDQIGSPRHWSKVSAARLALALVHPQQPSPIQ